MADADGIDVLALNGHLGERVRALWEGNLSRLDWERDFLAPFRERGEAAGYIGMGKTLSALNGVARLYGGAAAKLRERVTAGLLAAQEDAGYLGILAGEHRTYRTWDAHEHGYLLQALTEAWTWFGDAGARDGACRLAAWLLPRLADGRWRQVADGRRIRYYSPASGPRLWHPRDTYCCPGNYRRIVAELPSLIARRTGDGLALDLYETCRLRTEIDGAAVELRVHSGLPWSGTAAIEIAAADPVRFALRLRRPGWAESVVVAVNGAELSAADGPGWCVIDRTWKPADRVEITLDMPWHLVRGFRRQRGRVAIMRGPLLYATTEAALGDDGVPPADAAPDVTSCRIRDGSGHCVVEAELPDGQRVPLPVVPFSNPRVTETCFRGVAGAGDRRDFLLDVDVPAVGTPPAPGA